MISDRIEELSFRDKRRFDSNINRITKWINEKDIAGITAWRSRLENIHDPEKTLKDIAEGAAYSISMNKKRNRDLKTMLLSKGYGVTNVRGIWTNDQGDKEQEQSFIVVNLKDDPNFQENIATLSEYYNQDAYLYKPKGEEAAVLIGTNDSDFPGYGEVHKVGKFTNVVNEDFMSVINKKGFAFKGDSETETEFHIVTVTDAEIENYLVDESMGLLQHWSRGIVLRRAKELQDGGIVLK